MEFEVKLSIPAEYDVDLIIDYLSNHLSNPKAASDFADGLDDMFKYLAIHPLLFPVMKHPILAAQGYRHFPVGNYVGIYRVVNSKKLVKIVRLFHCRQNYLELL